MKIILTCQLFISGYLRKLPRLKMCESKFVLNDLQQTLIIALRITTILVYNNLHFAANMYVENQIVPNSEYTTTQFGRIPDIRKDAIL